MTFKELQELIKLINKTNLTEFKMKDGEFELSVRTKRYGKVKTPKTVYQGPPPTLMSVPPVAPAPAFTPPAASANPQPEAAPVVSAAPASSKEEENSKNYLEIKSPIVGTFYRSPSPDKPAYVKVGDVIEEGAVVCIVEAMKLFNEIESEIGGKIVKVMVEDLQPVEFDQVLFLVDPKG